MIYFFHHYELPAILQQARIQQIIIETHQQSTDSNGNNNHDDTTDGSGGASSNNPENNNNTDDASPSNNNNINSNSLDETSNNANNEPQQNQQQQDQTSPNLQLNTAKNFVVFKNNDELSAPLNKLAFEAKHTRSSFRYNLDLVAKKAIQTETSLNVKRMIVALRLVESIKAKKSVEDSSLQSTMLNSQIF